MTEVETLEMMRAWIQAAVEKAKRPYQDPFPLTSLSFCARSIVEDDATHKAIGLLQTVAAPIGRYDVFTPDEALALIAKAIEKKSGA